MGRDGEGGKKEVKGWKGRRKDLPDQCQTASYAPVLDVMSWAVASMTVTCRSDYLI